MADPLRDNKVGSEQQAEKSVGLVLGSHISPQKLPSLAHQAEEGGFREIVVPEDFFFSGAIAAAGAVLAATTKVLVTVGPLSPVVRHPALTAMEIATLADLHPGRVRLMVGLGAPSWLRQMGVMPASPLSAVRTGVLSIRALLEGESLSKRGLIQFDEVELTFPRSVPIDVAAIGPKMLALAGSIGDGTVLSVASPIKYVTWASQRIDEGRLQSKDPRAHRLATLALYSVSRNRGEARSAVRKPLAFYKSVGGTTASTQVYGIADDLREMLGRGGREALEREMPDPWISDMTIAGEPEDCAQSIQTYLNSGIDSVMLFPYPGDKIERQIQLTAEQVLPLVQP